MKVVERGGDVSGDGEAARPAGHQVGAPLPEQRVLQRAVGHEVVHKHHPAAAWLRGEGVSEREQDGGRVGCGGPSPSSSAVGRGGAAEEVGGQGELVVELALALEGARGVHDLDGDGLPRPRQRAAEDRAEAALPQLAPRREAARGAAQLLVRQPPQVGGGLRAGRHGELPAAAPPPQQQQQQRDGSHQDQRRGRRARGDGAGGRGPAVAGPAGSGVRDRDGGGRARRRRRLPRGHHRARDAGGLGARGPEGRRRAAEKTSRRGEWGSTAKRSSGARRKVRWLSTISPLTQMRARVLRSVAAPLRRTGSRAGERVPG